MRPPIGLEAGHAISDGQGVRPSEDRVGQGVELVGELEVGQGVPVVAGGMGDLADELGAVLERDP